MNAPTKSSRRWLSLIGILLLLAGVNVLFDQVHPAADALLQQVGVASSELCGFVPAAILTANHLAQAWAFDRANLLSTLRDMLLSFWPVILIIIGAAMLRKTFSAHHSLREQVTVSLEGKL